MHPNGETLDRIRNHPALKGVNIGNTGQNSHANLLVTKTLLMYGEGRGSDRYFRALDKKTGKEIAKIKDPVNGRAPGANGWETAVRTLRDSKTGSKC